MKPRPTMTLEQEAAWEATISGSKLVDKQAAVPVKRRRAYTMEELWELWAEWQSQDPKHRDGAEFLLSLEGK